MLFGVCISLFAFTGCYSRNMENKETPTPAMVIVHEPSQREFVAHGYDNSEVALTPSERKKKAVIKVE